MVRSSRLARAAAIGVAVALITLLSSSFSVATAAQDDVTFTHDVAPILFKSCVSCHRPGELAPMSLQTYAEVRPWARGIRDKVVSGEMPPWFATDARPGHFKNDSRLMQDEIDTITRWVAAGAPQGDPSDLPELPTFFEGWELGEPDLIVTLDEVTVPAEGTDYYPNLSHTLDIPEKRWIRAIEVRPSNRKVTHHSVIFTSMGAAQGGTESGFFDVLAVWSVGTNPHQFPEGMGRWVYPDQRWTINAHYHPSGTVETDRTQIGLYWGEGEMQKEVMAALAGSMAFEIPAGATNHKLRASYIIDQDVNVISFFPHMHTRGKNMDLIAHYPNGESQSLINIPNYNFDWQLFYYPQTPVSLPAGTRLDIVAHYDNSAGNPTNPDPSVDVGFGTQTNDEMLFNVFEFVADVGVSPKPASDETRRDALVASLPTGSTFSVDLPPSPMLQRMMGQNPLPTALHLPKDGEGSFYIPLMGNLMVLPAENLTWDGNAYRFETTLRFPGRPGAPTLSADFVVTGEVDDDGAIKGTFEAGAGGFSPFQAFEGTRAGADN